MPTVAPLDLSGHCLAVAFLGDVPHFALADGTVHRPDASAGPVVLHDGLLCAALSDHGDALLTGGEDGKVMRLAADGTATEPGDAGLHRGLYQAVQRPEERSLIDHRSKRTDPAPR